MIEVEKKCVLTADQEKLLTKNAHFINQKLFTDIYYDDTSYSLTRNNIWLRNRDGHYQLKIPTHHQDSHKALDQYKELDNLDDIFQFFKINKNNSFDVFLQKKKLNAFATFTTTRTKYRYGIFNIDLDKMDFGYSIAEIECMIEHEHEIKNASQSIIEFAKTFDIDTTKKIHGKLIQYIRINNPTHLKILINAGLVNE